jgi:hypothetical protein
VFLVPENGSAKSGLKKVELQGNYSILIGQKFNEWTKSDIYCSTFTLIKP